MGDRECVRFERLGDQRAVRADDTSLEPGIDLLAKNLGK